MLPNVLYRQENITNRQYTRFRDTTSPTTPQPDPCIPPITALPLDDVISQTPPPPRALNPRPQRNGK